MDDLVEWLRAQLDEDEWIAWEADGSTGKLDMDWSFHPEDDSDISGRVLARRYYVVVSDTPAGTGRHIAEHDPRRVLREIDAKRQILAAYEQALGDAEFPDHLVSRPAQVALLTLEPVVRHLATVYAGRPGYREGWRP